MLEYSLMLVSIVLLSLLYILFYAAIAGLFIWVLFEVFPFLIRIISYGLMFFFFLFVIGYCSYGYL